jgi:hypothetical protein
MFPLTSQPQKTARSKLVGWFGSKPLLLQQRPAAAPTMFCKEEKRADAATTAAFSSS